MTSFSAFDSRGYRTVAAREGYDRWAATYEDTVEGAMDIALLERVFVDWGGVGRVADLGCGTGRTGAWPAARGVGEIDGIDLSPGMLEAAPARGVYRSLQGEDFERNAEAVEALKEPAAEKEIRVGQLALAWLLAQKDCIVTIPGTRRIERLEENVGAAAVELSAEDLKRIHEILPEGSFGDRCAAGLMPEWD